MLEHLFGLLLLGLGIHSPVTEPMVKGDQVSVSTSTGMTVSLDDIPSEANSNGKKENRVIPNITRTPRATLQYKWLSTNDANKNFATNSALQHTVRVQNELIREQMKFREELSKQSEQALKKQEQLEAKFENKLENFRDERKKELVLELQHKFSELNINITQKAVAVVAKMASLLDKIIEKTEMEKANGKDTSAVENAISIAQKAIDSAQDAISVQSAKTYVVNVTTEESAKEDVTQTKATLAQDAKTMQQTIVSARASVSEAIRQLAIIRGENVPEPVIK